MNLASFIMLGITISSLLYFFLINIDNSLQFIDADFQQVEKEIEFVNQRQRQLSNQQLDIREEKS